MSKLNTNQSPFTVEDDDEVVVVPAPPPHARVMQGGLFIKGPRNTINQFLKDGHPKDDKKRSIDIDGSQPEGVKKQRPREVKNVPHSAPHKVTLTFAKLGNSNVSEADINSWSQSSVEENDVAITRAVTELFFRQATRNIDIRNLFSQNAKLENEVNELKFKLESTKNEKKNLVQLYQQTHKEEIDQLRKELREANSKTSEFEKARVEEQKNTATEIEGLRGRVAILEAEKVGFTKEKEAVENEAFYQGQVKYMKTFMKKLPDFDWGLLGTATKAYADELRAEIEEEEAT